MINTREEEGERRLDISVTDDCNEWQVGPADTCAPSGRKRNLAAGCLIGGEGRRGYLSLSLLHKYQVSAQQEPTLPTWPSSARCGSGGTRRRNVSHILLESDQQSPVSHSAIEISTSQSGEVEIQLSETGTSPLEVGCVCVISRVQIERIFAWYVATLSASDGWHENMHQPVGHCHHHQDRILILSHCHMSRSKGN